jgi:hypothetical protein
MSDSDIERESGREGYRRYEAPAKTLTGFDWDASEEEEELEERQLLEWRKSPAHVRR